MATEAFRGEFYQKVDGKARVSITAAFRRILDADDPATAEFPRTRMVMVYGGKHRSFVECYSHAGAEEVARMVEAIPLGTKDRLRAERSLIIQSVPVEIDDDGRIVLPPQVRDKLGLTPETLAGGIEAAFAGATNRFKLYRRDVYAAESEAEDEDDDGTDPLALLSKYRSGT
jgi:MraZ protein